MAGVKKSGRSAARKAGKTKAGKTKAGKTKAGKTKAGKTKAGNVKAVRARNGSLKKAPAKKPTARKVPIEKTRPRRRTGQVERTIVRVRELDPWRMCGPGTSVERLIRVDERVNGGIEAHLVFLDRHGWYCEHGRTCHAVGHARKHQG